jgi:hypothetical protein
LKTRETGFHEIAEAADRARGKEMGLGTIEVSHTTACLTHQEEGGSIVPGLQGCVEVHVDPAASHLAQAQDGAAPY